MTDEVTDDRQPDASPVGLPGFDYEFEVDNLAGYDEAYVMLHGNGRGIQPVIWRMRLHVHDHDCGRA